MVYREKWDDNNDCEHLYSVLQGLFPFSVISMMLHKLVAVWKGWLEDQNIGTRLKLSYQFLELQDTRPWNVILQC